MNGRTSLAQVEVEAQPTVLIVDDEELGQDRMANVCRAVKFRVRPRVLSVSSVQAAVDVLENTTVHVILLDKNLGPDERRFDHNGIESIPRFLRLQPHAQILVLTCSRDTQDAARAISLGAFWFLPKETGDELVIGQLKRALDVAELKLAQARAADGDSRRRAVMDFAGRSPAIRRLKDDLKAVAKTARPVLLLGETGCGKSTAAKLMHEYRNVATNQPRRQFYAINMGAISASIAERELFGNEKGAFTGADSARPGIFEMASGGTLFLDEIGEAPLELQAKLLTVIETGEFTRVGGGPVRKTSLKLICATNRDLERMVSRGEFREDLYYRIATLVVRVPSLAERRQDIPDIIRSLLPRACDDNNVCVIYDDLPPEFIDYLTSTPLRGNIRGIERLLVQLLVRSPQDSRGRPQLHGWRETLELGQAAAPPSVGSHRPLTLAEFMSRPLSFIGPGFPGLPRLMTAISDRILSEALAKYPSLTLAAAALGVSITKVSLDRKRMLAELAGAASQAGLPEGERLRHGFD